MKLSKSIKDIKESIDNIEIIANKIKTLKAYKAFEKSFFETSSRDPLFCKNKKLLFLLYRLLLSNKKYIIIEGYGGFGKTTLINSLIETYKKSSGELVFSDIINRRDFYDWNRINNKINYNNSINAVVVDNLEELNENDLNYINSFIDKNRIKKVIIVCRHNKVPIISGNEYLLIKCDNYHYNKNKLKHVILSKSDNEVINSSKVRKAIKKLYKNLPKSSLNPFVAKLTSNCIEGCNEKETINIIDNLTTAIKNVDSGLVTNDSICYILVNHLIDFENWDTADQKALLLFCIVFNENTFTDDEIHQLFSNTSIYDNKIWKKLSFIVSQEKYKYIHTIYVDFFLNIFDHEAENDRINLFNSSDFSRIIHNISNSLEMGKAKPYEKKIKYLAYAHNIYTILSKYLNIKNEVYQKLKINIKIDIVETLNSYSFMLAKLCNNEQEIFEAENVQNLLINLFSTVKKSEYESNDEYYSSLNRFYNVFAKIFLSKYVLSYIRKLDDWKTHLQQSEEMLKKSITQLDFIENIKNKESRKEIMSYTEALVLYKKSISAYYIERQDSINKALTAIKESEKCSLNEISTFISSQNININRDIIKYLKEYNSQKYEKVLIELIDLKSDKTKKDKHNILLNMLYSHIATLQLKCIVLFMVFYFNNYEKDHITINISQNDVKRIIDFTLRNLGNDIMRKRELMILNVEFHRLFLNKNIIDELLQYPDNIQEDDTRFKFLKNCVSFLSNRFDAIDFDDINNNCISYTINKDLFKKEDHKRNYREIEKIVYLLLTF